MARLAPYLSVHEHPNGPGDARPTAIQIIRDQGLVDSADWIGRVVLVTGCSAGGLGLETAKAIHLTGADVYITLRDVKQGEKVADEIRADGKPGKVGVIVMDLNSLHSIKAGTDRFLDLGRGKLDVLINNAGVMFCPQSETVDGFEMHIAANHLGHFYLFRLLKDALKASATPLRKSRVIQVSSAAHRYGRIDLEDLHFRTENNKYDAHAAYGQAKLANVHFANELDRRYQSQNIRALSVHPGGILTPLTRFMDSFEVDEKSELGRTMKNAEQGAATTVWGAVARELEDRGGMYLDEVSEASCVGPEHPYFLGGYATHAFDPPTEKALWEESVRLTSRS